MATAAFSGLISVVTPFYNNADFVTECVESVLAQTYENFEYIIVDNQSSDGGGEIARTLASKDPRIRFFTAPRFFAQAENFNFALSHISPHSAFTKVIMADDWLYPRCLEEMATLGAAHPSVGLIAAYRLIENLLDGEGLHPCTSVVSGREACRMHLVDDVFLFGTPSTVMYRSDLVRAGREFYPEGRIYQDTDAAFRILETEDFGFVHQVLSFSRSQQGSMTVSQQHLRSSELDRYVHVIEFGSTYLSPAELKAGLRQSRNVFYAGLVKHWLRERVTGRDPTYWEFQQRGLRPVHERIRARHVIPGIALMLQQTLRHPLDALRFARGEPTRQHYSRAISVR